MAASFEQKFFALANELLKMMKENDLIIIAKYAPEALISMQAFDMVNRNQITPERHILSDDEILSSEEALNYLFSWGVNMAMPEDN